MADEGCQSRSDFHEACIRGDVRDVQALFDVGTMMGYLDLPLVRGGLYCACLGGNLPAAQFLRGKVPCLSLADADNLVGACMSGQTRLVQWLAQECAGCDADTWTDAFLVACTSGSLALAKWLHATHPVDIHCKQDRAFVRTCGLGHFQVARWLLAQDPDYGWDPEGLARLRGWSTARDAWMRGCVTGAEVCTLP
jgi:hypothetical protein